jgi:hypothetical protein
MIRSLGFALRGVVAGTALALCSAAAQAPGDIRMALVIGNAAYPGPARLANPANDAKAMGDTLRGLGFDVVELRDGGKAQMQQAIDKLRDGLKNKQGIGMLYYAGHGLQLDWRNYMVPVDAQLASAADVPAKTIDVNAVIEAFKSAGTRMNILVLDACRDNPFEGAASGKGLAQLDAPPSTILAYATAPGNVAADGTGSNGLYTQYLLQELVKPQSKIEDVFKRTRFAVRRASQGRQIPWESTSLEDDFMFNAGKVVAVPKPDTRAREQAFNQEKADWERIAASGNVDDFFAFVARYPSGSYSELAQGRIERLQQPAVVAQPPQGAKPQQSFLGRYRDGDRYVFQYKDGLTGVVQTTTELVVRRKGDDDFEMSGPNAPTARFNSAGMVFQDGAGRFDPPWASVPSSELQVGRKVSGRSIHTDPRGQTQWAEHETRVVARETIASALGPLDTYKVEIQTVYQSGARRLMTMWYDPDWGGAVRQIVETRRPQGGAPEIRVRDLVSRQRGPG